MPTHWGESLLSSDRAAGGLHEGVPAQYLGLRDSLVYWNDFLTADDFGTDDWTTTDIGTITVGSVAVVADTANGLLRFTPDATAQEGHHVQMTAGSPGEMLLPAAGRVITVEFRVTLADWDTNHYFLGLGQTSGTFMAATGAIAGVQHVGFHYDADDDTGNFPTLVAAGQDNTQVTTTAASSTTLTDATFATFGIRIIGTTDIEWYVNGVQRARAALASAFNSEMCISMANVSDDGVADALDVDWVLASQTR